MHLFVLSDWCSQKVGAESGIDSIRGETPIVAALCRYSVLVLNAQNRVSAMLRHCESSGQPMHIGRTITADCRICDLKMIIGLI